MTISVIKNDKGDIALFLGQGFVVSQKFFNVNDAAGKTVTDIADSLSKALDLEIIDRNTSREFDSRQAIDLIRHIPSLPKLPSLKKVTAVLNYDHPDNLDEPSENVSFYLNDVRIMRTDAIPNLDYDGFNAVMENMMAMLEQSAEVDFSSTHFHKGRYLPDDPREIEDYEDDESLGMRA